jgi:beta-dihydromenaquinone-9 omega-hydroxylase
MADIPRQLSSCPKISIICPKTTFTELSADHSVRDNMTMRTDVRLARKYGPTIVMTLGTNIARDTWARTRRKRVPAGVEITQFDPFDHTTAAEPYPRYRELLAGGPVHYNRTRDIYILSRYADVRAAARADSALSSAEGVTYGRLRLPVLLTTDAPKHTRMRKQALPGFTRGALEAWQPMVDRLARELVGKLFTSPSADVVSTLAVPMPMGMIAHILGVADDDLAAFREWSNAAIRVADINTSPSGLKELVPTLKGFRELHAFFTQRLRRGELLGKDTVLGRLARHTDDGTMSHEELFFFAVLLLLAGNETTTNMLSTLFLTLADNPEQLRVLQERPDLIGAAIEEQLRYQSPIQSFYRSARVDYEVGSAVIPAGSRVLLLGGAANRDPRQFEEPDVFRADRNPTGHLAFGSGIHLCLGAQLARMEGQAVLREIVDNVDRIDAGPPTWTTNPNLRGLTRLNVRLARRPAEATA